jgi:uncharacterized membrane protein
MTTPASIKGHPVHAILVSVPVGLWIFALVADVAALLSNDTTWLTVAFYCIGGGVVGALVAAVPGLIDLLSLRDPAVRRIGFSHMALNLVAVGVFAANFLARSGSFDRRGPWWLTLAGVAIIGLSGWLGGEMVYRHGVGVEPSAAPSGASGRP